MNDFAISLAGTGMSLPALCRTSDEIDRDQGRAPGWLRQQCGVSARFVCGDESQESMGAAAALAALRDASIAVETLDLVISACGVARQPIPPTAPLIARELGIASGRCLAFDVNATCLSFLTGLEVAGALMRTGSHRTALVVSSEIASRALPWAETPATAGLFGDGAAAAVLARTSSGISLIRASHFETHHDGYEYCQIASGGTAIDFHHDPESFAAGAFFRMDGRSLFKLTNARYPLFLDRLLDAANWTRADIDLVVPHQASPLALKHLTARCGLPASRIIDIVADYGNQVAASIPTALHLARAAGRIGPGARVLALGTSAGVTFGGLALEFPS